MTWLDAAVQTLSGYHPTLKDSAVGGREAREELETLRRDAARVKALGEALEKSKMIRLGPWSGANHGPLFEAGWNHCEEMYGDVIDMRNA